MGVVTKLLAIDSIPEPVLFDDCARVKEDEFIAIYWRNVRIAMPEGQFDKLLSMLNEFSSVRHNKYIMDAKISPVLHEVRIEHNDNGRIHIHYLDFRIEMTEQEFIRFAFLIQGAYNQIVYERSMDTLISLGD